jgi:pyruvate, water dikinase
MRKGSTSFQLPCWLPITQARRRLWSLLNAKGGSGLIRQTCLRPILKQAEWQSHVILKKGSIKKGTTHVDNHIIIKRQTIVKIRLIEFFFLMISVNIYAQSSIDELKNKDQFFRLSGLPLSEKYGQVSSVKVVYDLETKKIYFINSKYFKYHHEFCNSQLFNSDLDLEYFNKENYSDSPDRRFLLANINYFESPDIFALEISPVDLMTDDQIVFLYDIICQKSFLGSKLKLLINSSRLQTHEQILNSRIPVITAESIYKNIDYQAISKYSSNGTLRFISDLNGAIDELTPDDIIVINETPLYLPEVAGIIVTEMQTPLSHLTILGQNRRIPICTWKSAFTDGDLLSLENRKIYFKVQGDNFTVKPADNCRSSKRKFRKISLKYDLSVDSLVDVKHMNDKAYRYCGNKASNFGILYKISKKAGFKTPENAFVIPFYFYNEHIKNSEAGMLIDSLLRNKGSFIGNNDSLKYILTSIREAIMETPIDESLVESVKGKIRSQDEFTSFRFRSSTNAEDTKGFSGAGLYSSKTGVSIRSKKSIENAIKSVWASLWSYNAFMEREYYNIDHRDVYMGILVHRSFPSEDVNGVAITKNIYRDDSFGFVVNAQKNDEKAVKPGSGITCDQFICYPDNSDNIYKSKNAVDIITVSNINDGKLVMTDSEIQDLANQLEIIKQFFYRHSHTSKTYINYGLDIEFKLDGENRDLYIKQVRIYND